MSFGQRAFETKDWGHFLYTLQLQGDVATILGEPAHAVRGKIVKLGLAKDPDERCKQHNACLPRPRSCDGGCSCVRAHCPTAMLRLRAETSLKERFGRSYRSPGGEFFLCDEKTLAVEFAKALPLDGLQGQSASAFAFLARLAGSAVATGCNAIWDVTTT